MKSNLGPIEDSSSFSLAEGIVVQAVAQFYFSIFTSPREERENLHKKMDHQHLTNIDLGLSLELQDLFPMMTRIPELLGSYCIWLLTRDRAKTLALMAVFYQMGVSYHGFFVFLLRSL